MRSGTVPPDSATAAATVTIGGVVRPAESAQVKRELGGGAIPGEQGMAAASGTVVTSQQLDIVSSKAMPSPWARVGLWPPPPGTSASVAVGTREAGVYSALTAVVDKANGDHEGNLTLSLVDPIDDLHRQVTIPPMLAAMPPYTSGGAYRRVGLSSDYIVSRALRMAGVCNTPYMPAATIGVSVPGQGSMWPDRGTCTVSASYDSTANASGFVPVTFGWAIADTRSVYLPSGNLTLSSGFEIALMCGSTHAAAATITVKFVGRTDTVNLIVSSGRLVTGNLNGDASPRPATGGSSAWTKAVLRMVGTAWSTSDDVGRTESATMTYPSGLSTAVVESVQINAAPGAAIAGVIVGNLGAGYYLNAPLTLKLRGGGLFNPKLLASPSIVRRDVADLIGEIADATCRAWWWDEDGTLTWHPGDTLLAKSVVTELTSTENLEDFAWEESLGALRSRVVVTSKTPSIARGITPSAEVWRGPGDATSAGTSDEVIHPSSDDEWIQVVPPVRLSDSTIPDFNAGPGSYYGGVTTANAVPDAADLSVDLTYLDPKSWRVSTTATGAFDQKAPDQTAIRAWKRGESLPVIRAYAKVTWSDVTTTAGSGPDGAAEHQHDAGPWLQGYVGEAPADIAGFLATWLCSPRTMIRSLSVMHDPRLQVGDVVSVVDTHAHNVTLTALVTRIEQDTSADDQSMVIDLFVITTARGFVTYDQMAAASTTYTALAAPTRTYSQLAANPPA